MFERFTDRARRVIMLAKEEALLLNHGFIATEHILLGLIQEGEGLAAKALASFGISLEAMRARVEEESTLTDYAPTSSPPLTPRSMKVLELSLREARLLGHNWVGTEHILLGLLSEGEGIGVQMLQSQGLDPRQIRARVIELLCSHSNRGEVNALWVNLRNLGQHLTQLDQGFDADGEDARRSLTEAFSAFNALARVIDPELVVTELDED